jgi:hypothetical protein
VNKVEQFASNLRSNVRMEISLSFGVHLYSGWLTRASDTNGESYSYKQAEWT